MDVSSLALGILFHGMSGYLQLDGSIRYMDCVKHNDLKNFIESLQIYFNDAYFKSLC